MIKYAIMRVSDKVYLDTLYEGDNDVAELNEGHLWDERDEAARYIRQRNQKTGKPVEYYIIELKAEWVEYSRELIDNG